VKRDRCYFFDERWKENRPWLKYDAARMWCTICVKFATKSRNVWANRLTGCTALRKEKAGGVWRVVCYLALTPNV
jgi:hypothetical protein